MMATIQRKVCDVDQREDDVQTVVATVGSVTRELDVCKRCLRDLSIAYVIENGGKPRPTNRASKRTFVKTHIPPQ